MSWAEWSHSTCFKFLGKKINRNAVKQIDQSIVLYYNLSFFWGILISFLISSVDSCSQYSIEPDTLCLSLWNFQNCIIFCTAQGCFQHFMASFSQSKLQFTADLAVNAGPGWHQQSEHDVKRNQKLNQKNTRMQPQITDCGWGSAKINSHNLKSTAWNSHHLNLKQAFQTA